MPSLFDLPPAESQREWTVAQLTGYIRELFEIDFRLRDVTVVGEISNFTRARSGHLYFTLKDAQAQLKCVMWRSAAEQLRLRLGDGDRVVARGSVGVYEASGQYQLYVDRLLPAGRGDLAQAFERLKQQLAAEGLFDSAHKQPIARFPRKIGIVTSADAAALRDILNVLRRRYPLVQVLIAPTLVQGSEAPAQIVRALRWLDGRTDIDTIIIARGGGSLEDLWAFNDEQVARAVFAAHHPIISGVGHEVDFTIVDFVADVRAPTPSVAAELAVPDGAQLVAYVAAAAQRLDGAIMEAIDARTRQIATLARMMRQLSPARQVRDNAQRLDDLARRLEQAQRSVLTARRNALALQVARLNAVSPQATLARGYAIVRAADGTLVRSVRQIAADEKLHVQVADGAFAVRVNTDHTQE